MTAENENNTQGGNSDERRMAPEEREALDAFTWSELRDGKEAVRSRGSETPQDETYARLRREGWSPMMGVLVLKKDGQLTLIDAAGAMIVTADSPNDQSHAQPRLNTDMKTTTTNDLLDRAVQALKERGPMKAKKLAYDLGLPNARSLSMQLQWAHDRVRYDYN